MEEQWLLINIDKREYIEMYVPSAHWEDATDVRTPLLQLITPPTIPSAQAAAAFSSPAARYSAPQRVGLLDLPPEPVQRLVRMLECPTDAVCLALTCRRAALFVHTAMATLVSPWARDRVVRVRGDVPAVDVARETAQAWWPAGVFTEAEQHELRAYCVASRCVPTLHAFLRSRYTQRDGMCGAPFDYSLAERIASSGSVSAAADAKCFGQWIGEWQSRTMTDPEDSKLALRNLSKKQFLRARDLRRLREELGLHQWALTLEHVALKRAWWRADNAGGCSKAGQGTVAATWAGDRFEVADMGEENGWVDVYEEVKAEYLKGRQSASRKMVAEDV